mmetsp:Transcript_10226/g.28902  ORF Transcript_10226/g.28902 Transcript_10226/m.28902 type:complete len:261 (-) Transcript_10226:143-925(-)
MVVLEVAHGALPQEPQQQGAEGGSVGHEAVHVVLQCGVPREASEALAQLVHLGALQLPLELVLGLLRPLALLPLLEALHPLLHRWVGPREPAVLTQDGLHSLPAVAQRIVERRAEEAVQGVGVHTSLLQEVGGHLQPALAGGQVQGRAGVVIALGHGHAALGQVPQPLPVVLRAQGAEHDAHLLVSPACPGLLQHPARAVMPVAQRIIQRRVPEAVAGRHVDAGQRDQEVHNRHVALAGSEVQGRPLVVVAGVGVGAHDF